MLIGLLIAITISVFVISGVFLVSNFSGKLSQTITAAVIGHEGTFSYPAFLFILSAVFLLVLVVILNRKNRVDLCEEIEFYRR